jgi:hypothetical protein
MRNLMRRGLLIREPGRSGKLRHAIEPYSQLPVPLPVPVTYFVDIETHDITPRSFTPCQFLRLLGKSE